jgi:catechol 2,3-dioxygenase-like lactoylglutathione lyase family enzyme
MSRIRHIAFLSDDPEQARRFYLNVFGVKELSRSKAHPNNVMLSDGEIFINIVKRRPEHNKPAGFYHIGFHVDKVELVRERLRNEGFSDQVIPRPDGVNAECRITDPDNVLIDIAETPWRV